MSTRTDLAERAFDVIVVGGGVVGAATASSLGRSGRKVLLLERDLTEPDRIVGELLQPGGVRALRLLGLLDCLEGIDAAPVHGYHVFQGRRSVPIPYPNESPEARELGIQSTSGRVEGRSFHHGRFVQALRRAAMAQPNVTTIQATVTSLNEDEAAGKVTGITATIKHPTTSSQQPTPVSQEISCSAPLTIVVDGCFSKFRRTHGSSIAPIVRSNFVALELHNAPLPSPNHGHVVLGPAGPTLLYQISASDTRVLIDVPGEKLPSQSSGALQAHIREKVIPQLPEVLRECVGKELGRSSRFRSMPNSFLPPSMQGQNKNRQGVILVGDAMNMRHPLTGGGMTVGLWDVVHLTMALGGPDWSPKPRMKPVADLTSWNSLKPALRSWHWERKKLASMINILAQALYSLFGAEDANLEVLREGCFAYFELGGECVGGPVRLLSGLSPEPWLLVYHFFSVALYAIYMLFKQPYVHKGEKEPRAPSILEWPALFLRSIAVLYTACVVLLPVAATELKSNIPNFSKGAGALSKAHKSGSSDLPSAQTLLSALACIAALLYFWNGQQQGEQSNLSQTRIFPAALAMGFGGR
ncbi:squalene monooxygenase [Ceraceosorus bombacis]|uniref:Squalene monooxygenase n=1 Tax=Ceraceosorus bombacis TaxID=401625 RepID=A0A0P1BHG6_9BASI|nr:squalene monooxygenase [Ceraceosorus bombacis]